LNPIQEKAKKGAWTDKVLFSDYGVKGYVDTKYICKILGPVNNPVNVEIAKMLCLEAICLATLNAGKKDYTCLLTFIDNIRKSYQAL